MIPRAVPFYRACLPWVLVFSLPATAGAHAVGLSRGEYELTGALVSAQLVFARAEVAVAVRGLDADHDGSISSEEVANARSAIEETFVRTIVVKDAAGTCTGTIANTDITEEDGLSIRAIFRCGTDSAKVAVNLKFLDLLARGHRHLATASTGSSVTRLVAYQGNSEFELVAASGGASRTAPEAVGWPLFRLGVQHILTGYDHLLFLFGLILVGGRLRSLMVVVTAFTVAHSITLGLAAFNVWSPSPAIVEPAIALSIVYVGVENWFVKDASRRWMITFPFGLVHGFGFAGALKEISLPASQIPLALAAFNIGVEAGQVAVLMIVLPMVLWLRRKPWFADRGVRIVSSAIALAGAWWFVDRIR